MPDRQQRCRVSVRIWAMVIALLWVASIAVAHNGEVPPDPPDPPDPYEYKDQEPADLPDFAKDKVRLDLQLPLRWSWVHWWEANRDRYLKRARQDGTQQMGKEARAALREVVETQLLAMADHEVPDVRARAILALSRAGWPGDIRSHEELLKAGSPMPVQWRALLGLGLQDRADGRALLLGLEPEAQSAAVARFRAFQVAGRIETGVRKHLWLTINQHVEQAGLPASITQLKPGNNNMSPTAPRHAAAAAALARHVVAAEDVKVVRSLREQTDPWVASELLLALGRLGNAKSRPILMDVARSTELGTDGFEPRIAAMAHLQARYVRSWDLVRDLRRRANTKVRIEMGIEDIYVARLRASAIIALAMHGRQAAEPTLVEVLLQEDNDYNTLLRGMAAMGLGETRSDRAAPMLMRMVTGSEAAPNAKARLSEDSPLPGYAALALGLYCRRQNTDQGEADPAHLVDALVLLAKTLANPKIDLETRCACAMGLGLSRRTANLRPLRKVSEALPAPDELLAGYIILARSMLGDTNIMAPAKRLLASEPVRPKLSQMMSRRAAALALGVLGSREAVPVLTEAWHLSYYVNREVIVALSLCDAQELGREISAAMRASKDPAEQAYFADVLGALLDAHRPSRLSRFVANTNYTMKSEHQRPFQSLGNEFLFGLLIPSLQGEWR